MANTDPGRPSTSSAIPPPPGYTPPTGNLPTDVYNSIRNIGQIPCARNSLLSGIASGVGIGVIRGLSAGTVSQRRLAYTSNIDITSEGPLVAGHWAMATFTVISLGSWHVCQRQIRREQQNVQKIIESIPKRSLKNEGTTMPRATE
ncbi:hypothetical protein BDN71DRAFT_1504704 [Pleurotus eryngii]|uniref:Cytochrome c oxidase assembly protein COX20, mitochondrial n=1 Tax=Pleurotus eryngii TaxID=5323 RepID=A0A9P6DHP1_PLEER|nr:hypothetical protein BDN71DRAFT_1504704 [Pleurotus eryngii]